MWLLRRLRGTSLLTRFATVSLLMTIAVGVGLSSLQAAVIEDRARQQAEDAALMAVRLGLQPHFTRAELVDGFDADLLAQEEQVVHDAQGQLLTGSFMDYALPRAEDMPRSIHIGSRSTASAF